MKNVKKWSFILSAILIVLLSACNNSTTGSFTGSDKKPLTISIASNDNIKLFEKKSNASRTIVADAFTTASGLHFYLWGLAQSGQELDPKEVTVTPSDAYNGKVILDIDCFNWSLTLAACPTAALDDVDDILDDAVLIGYGNVDMMFTNNIKFTLSPKGLSKTGKVNLTMTFEAGTPLPDGYTAKAYIYDIVTGKQIKGSENESLEQTYGATTAATITAFTDGASYTANGADIAPGTYSFKVEFTKPNEIRKYSWNDTLIILPGTTVAKNIVIPNKIGEIPNAPTLFKVEFNDDEDQKYEGYYSVHLSWYQDGRTAADGDPVPANAVDTENNFVLQIAELKGDDTIAAITDSTAFDAIWDDSTKYNKKYTFDYDVDIRDEMQFYKSGSLFANSTALDIYLELGKRYIARLYAQNDAGYSASASYASIVPSTNDTGATTMTTINRYRIKYYNQGGVWNVGETIGNEDTETKLLPKVEYWSQSNVTYHVYNSVKNGSGLGTLTDPYLYKGPAEWMYWITNLSTEEKYPVTNSVPNAYADYKNLNLYSIFSRQGDVEFYNDADYDIEASYVAGFGIAAGSISTVAVNEVSKEAIKDANNKTTVSITLPAVVNEGDPDWVYDKVSLEISYSDVIYFTETQNVVTRGTANTFEIPLTNLPTGRTYDCLLKAQHKMTTVSYPFSIKLKD